MVLALRFISPFVFAAISSWALAAPPPPPNFAREAALDNASCGENEVIASSTTIARKVESLTAEDFGGADGKIGELGFRWAYSLTSDDPRFGGITGLEVSPAGLIAISDSKHWIDFDMSQGGVEEGPIIAVAPMIGIETNPSGLMHFYRSHYVGLPEEYKLIRFALDICGVDARGVDYFELSSPVTALATVAYSYTLFSGPSDLDGSRAESVSNIWWDSPSLDKPEAPSVDGHELVDVSGPLRIVPFGMFGLWNPSDGAVGSILQVFEMPQWDDRRRAGETPQSTGHIVARLPTIFRALTAAFYPDEMVTDIFLATQAAPGEPTILLCLEYRE